MLRRFLLLGLAASCLSAPAFADPGDGRSWRSDRSDHEQRGDWRGGGPRRDADDARAGVRAGRLRPLSDVIGELQARYGGRLLGQELANEGPRTVYRIRWMTGDGRRLDLVINAQSR